MELSLLLPVLAALEMFPSLVSPSDPPSAPKLFLHPRHQEFIEGDRLTLRCSAQGVEGVTRYQFFDGSGKQLSEMPPNAYREAWLHLTANNSTIGAYSCAYWREESGKEVTSIKSSPISIQVKGAPEAPTFSVHPQHKEYHPGTSVELECSAPALADDIEGFQYFGDRIAISTMISSQRNHTYIMSITGREVSGSFSCCYWVNLLGRNVQSKRSKPVDIYVRGNLSRVLAVGGSFFTLNGLIFLATYFLMKHQDSRTVTKRRLQRAKPVEGSPKSSNPDLAEILSDEPTTPPASVFPVEKQDT
ncbi:uncharacterized protein LOC102451825 isoform X1 [Pelodiscus sinensis]|uniref:uncharacterized protein LOC102451825 isoform X1 n=1 Tax=Pelodiscus sinensis TaxID=13735 RepID=UPI003F6B5286